MTSVMYKAVLHMILRVSPIKARRVVSMKMRVKLKLRLLKVKLPCLLKNLSIKNQKVADWPLTVDNLPLEVVLHH